MSKQGNTVILVVIILAVLVLVSYLFINNKGTPQVPNNQQSTGQTSNPTDTMAMEEYQLMADLTDVSGGNASGTAYASFDEVDGYKLYAEFTNLPALEDGYFYEGWVVRTGQKLDVVSTGEVEKINSKFVNNFETADDLTDHDFYILTLEPDDGDPSPADHILEGTLDLVVTI